MSVVVAIKENGKVYLGADSQVTKVVQEAVYQTRTTIRFGSLKK